MGERGGGNERMLARLWVGAAEWGLLAAGVLGLLFWAVPAVSATLARGPAALAPGALAAPDAVALSLIPLGPVITDPCLGTRWQRMIDPSHPGGPARMVAVPLAVPLAVDGVAGSSASGASTPAGPRAPAASPMVIHAGDRLLVEQSNSVLVAHLEAVALEPAAAGQTLRARLRVGRNSEMSVNGPVIRVIAAGAGSARWVAAEGDAR